MEDHTGSPLLDLTDAAPDIIAIILGSMNLQERCSCALVCKAWAEAATAATHSIILEQKMQDVSGLQRWLEKHGNELEVLQLHACCEAALTALPCCAKLQDLLLLLHGFSSQDVSIASTTCVDIASAAKLTSVSLKFVQTASQQADVVAALTALPNLEQLTWHFVSCKGKEKLSNSLLLQQMVRLTSLDLSCVTAAALQHLGSLTKLQHLSISAAYDWAAAGCPGLQELKALTSLKLLSWDLGDFPAGVSLLTALHQLEAQTATPTALSGLHVLTNLTQLCVWHVTELSPESPPLKLLGMQHLELHFNYSAISPMLLASCTQLQLLRLACFELEHPGSLVASPVLQHLELDFCNIAAADDADDAADPVSWQQVFPGPGRLPHLTYLKLGRVQPAMQQADMDCMVACCSNLKVLQLVTLEHSSASALAQLPGLTNLCLDRASDEDCSAMVQSTGLRELIVRFPWELTMSAVGLRQLAALQQLTSLCFGRFSRDRLDTSADHFTPGDPYTLINKAPSGSSPDVSSQLLDICDVVDACDGLSIDEVTAAAYRMMRPSSSGPSGNGFPKPLTAEALLAAAAALKARGD